MASSVRRTDSAGSCEIISSMIDAHIIPHLLLRILFLAPCRSLPLLSLLCGVELPLVKLFNGELDREDRIAEASGFDIPDGCSPEYAVRRTNKGKPGRPRKNRLVVKDS